MERSLSLAVLKSAEGNTYTGQAPGHGRAEKQLSGAGNARYFQLQGNSFL